MSDTHSAELPSQADLRILQTPDAAPAKVLPTVEHLLILLPEKPPAALWKQIPDGARLRELDRKRHSGSNIIRSRIANQASTGVSLGKLSGSTSGKKPVSAFDSLSFCGQLAAATCEDNPASVAIMVVGFEPEVRAKLVQHLILALSAHRFTMPAYKSKAAKTSRLKTVRVLGKGDAIEVRRTLAEAKATNLVRWLTAQPPNRLDASSYLTLLKKLSSEYGWKLNFLNESKLKKAGAGAFLAVSQGNATRDAGIVHIQYRPTKNAAKPDLALVGKGIIFDTGGTNLKPFKGMLDMHMDMSGSAVAVATLAALTELRAPFAIDCWLAITENCIGPDAYKPRDIVTASNGVTIEVIHTDAEGRMALADTLALAGEQKPTAIIDFATLTGSCVAALSDRYSGALTNQENLNELLITTGRDCGERVWPFPMDQDFDEEIHSDMADVVQCAAAGGGDHIQAARFLSRFVPKQSTWVHIDLSAASRKGGLAQVPTEITGFGARYAISLVLDSHDELLNAAKDIA
jgi:leucyl aminopeptidase